MLTRADIRRIALSMPIFVWYEKAPERLPDLVRMAWARVAPKRLLP